MSQAKKLKQVKKADEKKVAVSVVSDIRAVSDSSEEENRLPVLKTYKLYIGGKFSRTESGRFYSPKAPSGVPLGNVCRGSRKDLREAVVAARSAFNDWTGKSAYNRGQILYRIGEMLEGRKAQFVSELMLQGSSEAEAEQEVASSIDRLIYYAGWADKYPQIFGSVNPVSSSHFNFSIPEPTGVVGIVAPEKSSLLGLITAVAPAIVGGNTCVVLASTEKPLCSVSFSEVLHSSDVPGGVVNILTGLKNELLPHIAGHMDVNAVVFCGDEKKQITLLQKEAAKNVKRVILRDDDSSGDLSNDRNAQGPYHILDTQEIKTTWHPIGK